MALRAREQGTVGSERVPGFRNVLIKLNLLEFKLLKHNYKRYLISRYLMIKLNFANLQI